ncbi:hypothetical protein [Paracoccus cavernae]
MFERAQHREGHPAFPATAGHRIVCADPAARRVTGPWGSGLVPKAPRLMLALPLLAALAACGRAPTDDILRGGVPARTDLHATTALPADAVRSVARKDAGWRLIYHPDRAPQNAEQRAGAALCRLEGKRPEQLVILPMSSPTDDPGARMIDVICG